MDTRIFSALKRLASRWARYARASETSLQRRAYYRRFGVFVWR